MRSSKYIEKGRKKERKRNIPKEIRMQDLPQCDLLLSPLLHNAEGTYIVAKFRYAYGTRKFAKLKARNGSYPFCLRKAKLMMNRHFTKGDRFAEYCHPHENILSNKN